MLNKLRLATKNWKALVYQPNRGKYSHPFWNVLSQEEMERQDRENERYIKYHNPNGYYKTHNNFSSPKYEQEMQRSIDDPRGFWAEKAQDVHWHKPFESVLDDTDIRFPKWFKGGLTNMSFNCLDRHIEAGRGDMPCFFEISAYTGHEETYTYKQVHNEVGRLASVL